MVLSPLSQNRAMEGDAVLDRVVQLERLVMEKFAEMKADNQELRQTLQEMGERLANANQANSQQAAGHHDAISVDAPAERESVDFKPKKEEPARKGPQMGEDESQNSVEGRGSAAAVSRADKEMGGAEKAKKGAVSRRVAKEFLDEGIRQNSKESNGEKQNGG